MKPYILYIIIGIFFMTLIRTTLTIDRSERDQRLYDELCQVDESYCIEEWKKKYYLSSWSTLKYTEVKNKTIRTSSDVVMN